MPPRTSRACSSTLALCCNDRLALAVHGLRHNTPGLLQRWSPMIDHVPLSHSANAGEGCAAKPGSHVAMHALPLAMKPVQDDDHVCASILGKSMALQAAYGRRWHATQGLASADARVRLVYD